MDMPPGVVAVSKLPAAIGQLIARAGSGPLLAVGTRATITAGGSGYIYMAYNDSAYPVTPVLYTATITNNGASTGR